jgi:uncharacterized protein
MRRLSACALIALAALGVAGTAAAQAPPATPTSPAKKELIQRLLRLQQSDVEGFARTVVERPAAQMMREAGMALQQQSAPQEKREASARAIEAEVKKYVDEAYPIVRDRALKLAPSTIGPVFEARMTEDELKQLIAWLESPINKKYAQIGPEMQTAFVQKLVVDARPVVDPKLQALDAKVRSTLGLPAPGAASAPAASRPASAPKSK